MAERLKETNQAKIKVLETKRIKFEGKHYAVPTKFKIGEEAYEVMFNDDIFGEVRDAVGGVLALEELKGVTLKEIPAYIDICLEAPESLGELKLSKSYTVLEILERAKYYRRAIPIDYYFDAIKKIALKFEFEIVYEDINGDYYFLHIGKQFPENTNVAEVYKSFEQIAVKLKEIEHKIEEAIKSELKSI